LSAIQQSTYVAATVALAIATASVVYGLTNDDILTALGALLLVPSIILLYSIANRQQDVEFSSRQQQTN
jgi:ACR3 family arsenite efflux pump ArsB